MKTIAINETINRNKNNNVAFKGHSAYLADTGLKRHKFFMPYDSNKYNAQIEFQAFEEKNGNWVPTTNSKKLPLPVEGISIKDYNLFSKGKAVGYRFIFTDKENPNNKFYKIDSGIVTNPLSARAEDNYSILLNNRNLLPENKLTKQVMPDLLPGFTMESFHDRTYEISFDPEARLKALNYVRNHGNKLGGNFAGIIKMLPRWSNEGYTKIIGTPFTKDEVSSHLYWTETPYQISSALGTLEDFKTLQIELFKNGINFIADGAFVNQGLQGFMFKNVLKHGLSSPFAYWFKAPGLLDGALKIGAIPRDPKARENFKFRVVNLPIKIEEDMDGYLTLEKNKDYSPKKPSYLQLYDGRLVYKGDSRTANKILTNGSTEELENPYEVTNHDDLTQILTFEINAEDYTERLEKAFKKLSKEEKTFGNKTLVENLLKFPNFQITTKDKGGIDLWDGNMDIAKLNFYIGNTDQLYSNKFKNSTDRISANRKFEEASFQVQDFTLKAGKYWTQLVANTQFEHVLRLFRYTKPTTEDYLKTIQEEVKKGNLPKITTEVMTKDVIENIVSGKYISSHKNITLSSLNELAEIVRKNVMEQPLAAYEFSPDLSAVLASPYISHYATRDYEIGQLRYDQHIDHIAKLERIDKGEQTKAYLKMNEYLYTELSEFVSSTLHQMNLNRDLLEPENLTHNSETKDVTDVGQYLIPLIVPDLVKYVIIKSLNPKAEVYVNDKTGEVIFDPKTFSNISLKSLGISGSPEDEAIEVINRLKKGTKKLLDEKDYEQLAIKLKKRVQGVSLTKLRMADAIIDRTKAGLGWRIDAAKDIGNIDAIRSNNDNSERLLNELSKFWGRFNDVVKTANRNAYTTAEITDFDVVVKNPIGEFKNSVDAETKFVERSGLNNTANYMFFYSLLRDMFSAHAEHGGLVDFNNISALKDKLIKGWEPACHGFLYQYPEDSIINSYTFVGNHDKPRVLHLFALDMSLFHSDFSSSIDAERAARVLGYSKEELDKIDIYSINGKAIAMGERLLDALEDCNLNDQTLKDAIAQLASGYYKGEKFDSNAFGARDFRFVINDVFEVAKSLGYKSNNIEKEKDAMLESILTPAMDKMETVYKMLVTLPGSPTDFVGDKEGSTGYESKSNNQFQQNRNTVPFEWVNDAINMPEYKGNEKEFAKNYYIRMTKIGNLRNKKELSALRNGDTIALPLQKATNQHSESTDVAATFRYNDKGSQVICLYTTAGAKGTANGKTKMNRPRVDLEKIVLSDDSNWKCGLKGGLKEGDIFKNYNDPCAEYEVKIENGQYVLKNKDKRFNISIMPEDKNTAILYKYNPDEQPIVPAHFVLTRIR